MLDKLLKIKRMDLEHNKLEIVILKETLLMIKEMDMEN
jgi:hypothetical protein